MKRGSRNQFEGASNPAVKIKIFYFDDRLLTDYGFVTFQTKHLTFHRNCWPCTAVAAIQLNNKQQTNWAKITQKSLQLSFTRIRAHQFIIEAQIERQQERARANQQPENIRSIRSSASEHTLINNQRDQRSQNEFFQKTISIWLFKTKRCVSNQNHLNRWTHTALNVRASTFDSFFLLQSPIETHSFLYIHILSWTTINNFVR